MRRFRKRAESAGGREQESDGVDQIRHNRPGDAELLRLPRPGAEIQPEGDDEPLQVRSASGIPRLLRAVPALCQQGEAHEPSLPGGDFGQGQHEDVGA